ncbi:MAG: hypothetical protein K6F86_04035 [Lachnospiraceae bacterium]|nr:hypothetical protein [Lachnospiraceae bacterium]
MMEENNNINVLKDEDLNKVSGGADGVFCGYEYWNSWEKCPYCGEDTGLSSGEGEGFMMDPDRGVTILMSYTCPHCLKSFTVKVN